MRGREICLLLLFLRFVIFRPHPGDREITRRPDIQVVMEHDARADAIRHLDRHAQIAARDGTEIDRAEDIADLDHLGLPDSTRRLTSRWW